MLLVAQQGGGGARVPRADAQPAARVAALRAVAERGVGRAVESLAHWSQRLATSLQRGVAPPQGFPELAQLPVLTSQPSTPSQNELSGGSRRCRRTDRTAAGPRCRAGAGRRCTGPTPRTRRRRRGRSRLHRRTGGPRSPRRRRTRRSGRAPRRTARGAAGQGAAAADWQLPLAQTSAPSQNVPSSQSASTRHATQLPMASSQRWSTGQGSPGLLHVPPTPQASAPVQNRPSSQDAAPTHAPHLSTPSLQFTPAAHGVPAWVHTPSVHRSAPSQNSASSHSARQGGTGLARVAVLVAGGRRRTAAAGHAVQR